MRSLSRLLFGKSRGRLPDFLCLGAQRAGTTTLHDHLRRHPDVYLPAAKEIHYFSLHAHRPLRWYESWFARAAPGQRAGDISPYYLFHPRAPAAIANALPQARLIVLLRDPVDRALSGYFHARRHGMESLGLEAAFACEEARLQDTEQRLLDPRRRNRSHQWHSYIGRSRYDVQLDRYLAHVPATRLLLVRSEDFFADPRGTLGHVEDFLGLSPAPCSDATVRRNAGNGELATVGKEFRTRLRDRLDDTYEAMRRRFGMTWEGAGTGGTGHVS
jgi:hypothetical protein